MAEFTDLTIQKKLILICVSYKLSESDPSALLTLYKICFVFIQRYLGYCIFSHTFNFRIIINRNIISL